MNQDHLKAAERLAMEIAAPLPAIMNLVTASTDDSLPAITILLRDVDHKAAELCEVLSRLQQDAKPPA